MIWEKKIFNKKKSRFNGLKQEWVGCVLGMEGRLRRLQGEWNEICLEKIVVRVGGILQIKCEFYF